MPVIRITDATWDRLKSWAVPLEDSPEDAVRKALDAAEEYLKCSNSKVTVPTHKVHKAQNRSYQRLAIGLRTPQSDFHKPILDALYELGGRARIGEVLNLLEKGMIHVLKEVDREKLSSGVSIRWHNTAQWARLQLVHEGLLKDDSPKGIWELSSKGSQELDS